MPDGTSPGSELLPYPKISSNGRGNTPNAREWTAAIPLLILMVWLGVGAQTFLPRISDVTATILKESTLNVPFRVAAPSATQGRELASAR